MKVKRLKYWDSTIDTRQISGTIEPSLIEIVGFVVAETDTYITLATEIITEATNTDYRGQVSIPKVVIIGGGDD
jgi:hypothetical protein